MVILFIHGKKIQNYLAACEKNYFAPKLKNWLCHLQQ